LYKSERGQHTDAVQVKGTAAESRKQEWYGRIEKTESGYKLVRSRKIESNANDLLEKFCDRPSEVIKKSSQITGKCVFSDKRLTDIESIRLGYYQQYGEEFGLLEADPIDDDPIDDPIEDDPIPFT
jgi:hypothetical protein